MGKLSNKLRVGYWITTTYDQNLAPYQQYHDSLEDALNTAEGNFEDITGIKTTQEDRISVSRGIPLKSGNIIVGLSMRLHVNN